MYVVLYVDRSNCIELPDRNEPGHGGELCVIMPPVDISSGGAEDDEEGSAGAEGSEGSEGGGMGMGSSAAGSMLEYSGPVPVPSLDAYIGMHKLIKLAMDQRSINR